MTWSIVARDAESGALGIAIASRVVAVGAMCPHIRQGIGAVSSQSFTNPLYGPDALNAMASGLSIADALEPLIAADQGRAWRQVHGIDADGTPFGYTGASCVAWNGMRSSHGVSVAGNMISGPEVVDACHASFVRRPDLAFPERLLTALAMGELAGGDKRGKQSAALLVVGDRPYPIVDIRVDEHPEPIGELRRIHDIFVETRIPYLSTMATRENPAGIFDPKERADAVAAYIAERSASGGAKAT